MESAEIKAYHELYRKELFDYVVPFWLNHSLDRECGGYLTLLERDGTVFDTDKYAWMQGREIWMFSKLCSVYGTRPEWVEAASLGVAFMRAHGRAENGDYYFAMDRHGNALIHPYNIFSDCFMCTALAEYSRVTGDEQAHAEALEIYRRIQQRKLLRSQFPEGHDRPHAHFPANIRHQRPHQAVPRGHRPLVDGEGLVRHQSRQVHGVHHPRAAAFGAGPLGVEGQLLGRGGIEMRAAHGADQLLPRRHRQRGRQSMPVWAPMAGQPGIEEPQAVEQLRPGAKGTADPRHAGALVQRKSRGDIEDLLHAGPGSLGHPPPGIGG